ncbi:MAG: hypothetical protein EDQ89_13190, partial [Acidobacteria bacterium]
MANPLLVVDAPSMLYRAYYALPKSIAGAGGRPVNALLGTANLVVREVAEHDPRAVVLCFGAEAARYRVELHPGYHADRPEMPERLDDGRRYRFRLKEGVRFHDDPCFPGGRGRTVRADDVFYSWKRLADKRNGLKNWWLLEDTIVGLDAFKEAQNAALDAGGSFDYDAPVEGFVKRSDLEFEVVLTKPVFRFLWVLTMFQSSIVPREAVERYG